MSSAITPLLVSPRQLRDLSSDVSILDASWFMPNAPRKPREEFLSKRIPGAQFLDLDEVASKHELGLKHMMPSPRSFADACELFGIEPSSHVVIYDSHGVFSSPRALFMFRSFGHTRSSVLDGGLPRWESEGLPTESGPLKNVKNAVYPEPKADKNIIRSYQQIVSNSQLNLADDTSAQLVIDARPRGRYLGIDPEPRPGLSSGHIPGSYSLPFNYFLQINTSQSNPSLTYTTFLPPSEIHKALVSALGSDYAEKVLDGTRPITTTCGSGMTAAVLWLGLSLLGVQRVGLYDESWTGYASRQSSKIEKSQ